MTARRSNGPKLWIWRFECLRIAQTVCTLSVFVAGCGGCRASRSIEISGTVVTSKLITDSYLGSAVVGAEDERVAGATIILAFDKDGTQQVKGCYAESEKDGSYRIKAEKVPASPTKYGNDYYLVVKKEGFAPLVRQISVGPFSQYNRNTVWLKPVVK